MNPRTVDEVITDFKVRRAGIVKAIDKDFEILYNLCDPKHPASLCLYGLPSQRWEVNSPPPPSEIPSPQSGINLVRDDMPKDEWLSMVALHSDTWLYSVASYFCVKNKFDKADRKRLFNKISDVGFVSELITGGGGGGTSRKRSKVESKGLPEEIVAEVLARLPVKDLLRYRSVCNKWRGLIDDPTFVAAHVGSYKSNIVGDRLLVNVERPRRRSCNSERVLVRHSDTFRQAATLKNLNAGKYEVLGYVNGLVMVRKRSYAQSNITLWNPSINKSRYVPITTVIHTIDEESNYYYEFGLGFDASVNDYKVVLFTYPYKGLSYYLGAKRFCATILGPIQIYSVRTNSWTAKNGTHPPSYWAAGPQVYVNGAIHWLGFGPNETDESWASHVNDYWQTSKNCSHIVSYDIGKEMFNFSELPADATESGKKDPSVTVIDGCLGILRIRDCLHDIWVMKEFGNSNSWSKCYTFRLTYDKGLYFKENGEFLYAVDGVGIKSYDVKRNCVRDLAKTYCQASTYTVFTHVESLVMSTLPMKNSRVRH